MSERFEYMENECGCGIWDNEDIILYNLEFDLKFKENVKVICRKLNKQQDEIKRLREELRLALN